MKTFIKMATVLAMCLAFMVACSEKSPDQQSAAPGQEKQAQPAAQAPAQEPAAKEQAQQPAVQQPSQQAADQPKEAAPGQQAASKPEEISGTIVKTEEGLALFSDAGNFMIAGQELDTLVGKNVKVTGTIDEGSGKPMINVTSVSVIE